MSNLCIKFFVTLKKFFSKILSLWLCIWKKSFQIFHGKFFQDSSIHIFSHLAKTGDSRTRRTFWLGVSLITFSFCTFHIVHDFKRLKSDSEITITRSMTRDEMEDINISICFNHWVMWVSAHNVIEKYNLSRNEFITLVRVFKNKFVFDEKCPVGYAGWNTGVLTKIGLKNNSWYQPNIILKITEKIMSNYVENPKVVMRWKSRKNNSYHRIFSIEPFFDIKNGVLRVCQKYNSGPYFLEPSHI